MNITNSFYVTLLSDKAERSTNKSDFTTKLAKTINFKKEEWKVALVELIIPSHVININATNDSFYLAVRNIKTKSINYKHETVWLEDTIRPDFQYVSLMEKALNKTSMRVYLKDREPFLGKYSNNIFSFNCSIPHGGYTHIDHLLEVINSQIDKYFAKALLTLDYDVYKTTKTGVIIKLVYDHTTKRIFLKSNDNNHIGLIFHKDIIAKFGGSLDNLNVKNYGIFFKNNREDIFKYNVDLNINFNNLYIYSDIVEHTIVGHTESQLLRIIEYQTSIVNNNNHLEFKNYHYLPVSKSNFDELTILIRGDTGEEVHFMKGLTIVKLHFKKF